MVFSKLKAGMLVAASLAFIPGTQANEWRGFYLGANLGGSIVLDTYSFTNGLNGANNFEVSGSGRNSSYSGSLGVSGGYSHLVTNSLLLGGELFIDGYLGSRQSSFKTERVVVKAQRVGPAYGFLARAGFVAYPKILVYAGVGGKFSKFTYKIITDVSGVNGHPEASLTKRTFKPLVEVGLEGMLNTRVGWRASYNCAFGRSATMGKESFPANHVLNQNGDNPSAKFSSTEHGFKLGAFYRF
ncbi:MAG: hypothetical protein K0R52_1423 [Alphaproteobacteria bacterium]|nr:hypothetical protein [Alphaproteobacteria bacterium]